MDENPRPADNAGIDAPDDTAEEIPSVDPEVEKAIKVEAFHADLNRETRSTGFWMLVWGGLSLVASGIFDASWGVMLIVIGIASFFLKDVAMLVVYAVTMAWAAVWNLLSSYLDGTWTWAIFSLFQAYWAVRIFQGYARFSRAKAELSIESTGAGRVRRVLPVTGCLFSMLAAAGVVTWTVSIMLAGAGVLYASDDVLNLTMNLVINLAVLGFALCLGALLSGYRYKAITIIGMAVCLLLILGWFVILLLP